GIICSARGIDSLRGHDDKPLRGLLRAHSARVALSRRVRVHESANGHAVRRPWWRDITDPCPRKPGLRERAPPGSLFTNDEDARGAWKCRVQRGQLPGAIDIRLWRRLEPRHGHASPYLFEDVSQDVIAVLVAAVELCDPFERMVVNGRKERRRRDVVRVAH